jgi:hypothetical protein
MKMSGVNKVIPGPRAMRMFTRVGTALALGIACLAARAQELEPRAYSPSPIGTGFLTVGFGRSSGGVSFDPTVPINDVHALLYSQVVGLGQTFGFFGRQSLITVALPYVVGTVTGQVGEQTGSVTRSGLADLKLRLSCNLYGVPALKPAEFAVRPHRSAVIAASISVEAPTGQYDNTKLINLGTNRWAFKPEIGLSYPLRKFYFDVYTGAYLFGNNPHYYPGQASRTEDVLYSVQAHVSYTILRGFWAAFDSTWYGGGAVRVNDGPPAERQSSSRLGTTLSVPLTKHHSIKLSYSSGVTARVGANFSTLGLSWQYLWFERH